MAKLSRDEQEQLDRLVEKSKAPDRPQMGRSAAISFDLGDLSDDKRIKKAIKMGLLDPFDDDDEEEAPPKDEEQTEADETPRRRGYFERGE